MLPVSQFPCKFCVELGDDKSFNSKGALTRHERQCHGVPLVSHGIVECPLCTFSAGKPELREHYKRDHGFYLEKEVKNFYSTVDFEQWKSDVERTSNVEFVRRRPPYTMVDGTERIVYSCSRDGSLKSRSPEDSKKVSTHCPSEMRLSVSDSLILVEFVGAHVGHSSEPKQVRSSRQSRSDVLLIDGLNEPTSVERLQPSIPEASNIDATFTLLHQNVDLKAWVEVMNSQKKVIRYFKLPGDPPPDDVALLPEDFIIIMFNDAMMSVLKKFGSECICVDRIKVIRDNYDLTSIIIVDEFKQGLPVAFMLSNRTDFVMAKLFFETIKDNLGTNIEAKLFMSEMGVMFCSAWSSVMPPAKIILYSAWHVDAAWRENLSVITDETKRSEVYKNLQLTMDEKDEGSFNVMFENICRSLMADFTTVEFGNYFIDNFGSSAILWANCCRKNIDINPKLSLERAHKTIEHVCSEGKNVKTLNKAAQDLMTFARDKLIDRLTQRERPSHKLKDLKNRHEKIRQLKNCQLLQVNDEWLVNTANSSTVARITSNYPSCPCALKCVLCHKCSHNYVCSCPDSMIKWNMCKHIHFLCEHLNELNGAVAEDLRDKTVPGQIVKFEGYRTSVVAQSPENVSNKTNCTTDDKSGKDSSTPSRLKCVETYNVDASRSAETENINQCKRKVKEMLLSLMRRVDRAKTLDEVKMYDDLISPIMLSTDAPAKKCGKAKVVPRGPGVTSSFVYVPTAPTPKKIKTDTSPTRKILISKSDETESAAPPPVPAQQSNIQFVFSNEISLESDEEFAYAEEVVLL